MTLELAIEHNEEKQIGKLYYKYDFVPIKDSVFVSMGFYWVEDIIDKIDILYRKADKADEEYVFVWSR